MSDGPRFAVVWLAPVADSQCSESAFASSSRVIFPCVIRISPSNPPLLSLHGERRFPIVGCDEPEVDEDLADRAAEVRSERRTVGAVTDDHVGVGRPTPVSAPAHLAEQARDIRLGDGELGNDDLVQRQTGVP